MYEFWIILDYEKFKLNKVITPYIVTLHLVFYIIICNVQTEMDGKTTYTINSLQPIFNSRCYLSCKRSHISYRITIFAISYLLYEIRIYIHVLLLLLLVIISNLCAIFCCCLKTNIFFIFISVCFKMALNLVETSNNFLHITYWSTTKIKTWSHLSSTGFMNLNRNRIVNITVYINHIVKCICSLNPLWKKRRIYIRQTYKTTYKLVCAGRIPQLSPLYSMSY